MPACPTLTPVPALKLAVRSRALDRPPALARSPHSGDQRIKGEQMAEARAGLQAIITQLAAQFRAGVPQPASRLPDGLPQRAADQQIRAIPADTRYRNVGTTTSRHRILTTPAGFEAFFACCADEFAQAGGPEMGRSVELHREHNLEFIARRLSSVPVPRLTHRPAPWRSQAVAAFCCRR